MSATLTLRGRISHDQMVRIYGAATNFPIYQFARCTYGKSAIAQLTNDEAEDLVAQIEIWEADVYEAEGRARA